MLYGHFAYGTGPGGGPPAPEGAAEGGSHQEHKFLNAIRDGAMLPVLFRLPESAHPHGLPDRDFESFSLAIDGIDRDSRVEVAVWRAL